MILLDEKDKKVEIYDFLVNKKKMYEYKKEQMSNIPDDRRILKANTNNLKTLEDDEEELLYSEVDYQCFDMMGLRAYHSLNPNLDTNANLLENYYNSIDSHKVYHVNGDYNFKTKIYRDNLYLMPLDKYSYNPYNDYYIENVFSITKELFYLEKFLQGKYKNIPEDLILKYLEFYKLNQIKKYDLDLFDKLSKLALINEKQFQTQIDNSAIVLKLIKKD